MSERSTSLPLVPQSTSISPLDAERPGSFSRLTPVSRRVPAFMRDSGSSTPPLSYNFRIRTSPEPIMPTSPSADSSRRLEREEAARAKHAFRQAEKKRIEKEAAEMALDLVREAQRLREEQKQRHERATLALLEVNRLERELRKREMIWRETGRMWLEERGTQCESLTPHFFPNMFLFLLNDDVI